MALAGNGRWCYLDPKLGAMHAVAEAARKVACTGATPVAATNCLNFGNPQKPKIMAQLSHAIDGIAEACNALGTPVTGGNVSLYNETLGEGIYPTPVIGVVGILDDVTKAVPSVFQQAGDVILDVFHAGGSSQTHEQRESDFIRKLGPTEFAKVCVGSTWGDLPALVPTGDADCNRFLVYLATQGLISSAFDIGSGGIAVALCRAALSNRIGAIYGLCAVGDDGSPDPLDALDFFTEGQTVVVTCRPSKQASIERAARNFGLVAVRNGITTEDPTLKLTMMSNECVIDLTLAEAERLYSQSFESQLAEEVLA